MINPAPRQSPSLQRSFSKWKRLHDALRGLRADHFAPSVSIDPEEFTFDPEQFLQGSFGDCLMMKKQRSFRKGEMINPRRPLSCKGTSHSTQSRVLRSELGQVLQGSQSKRAPRPHVFRYKAPKRLTISATHLR